MFNRSGKMSATMNTSLNNMKSQGKIEMTTFLSAKHDHNNNHLPRQSPPTETKINHGPKNESLRETLNQDAILALFGGKSPAGALGQLAP